MFIMPIDPIKKPTKTTSLCGERARSVILLVLGIVFFAGTTLAQEVRYQSLFYPKGLPLKKDFHSGTERKALYKFYSEAELLPVKARAILFSERTGAGISDNLFNVFLGLVEERKGKLIVQSKMDVTKFISIYVEEPGNFYDMDGVVNFFTISKNMLGIHVNIWAVISGSGAQSAASDLFFLFDPKEKKIKPILTLNESSKFAKSGDGNYVAQDTSIYLTDIDHDLLKELLIIEEHHETNALRGFSKHVVASKAKVYKFKENAYRFTNTLTDIPTDAVVLQRSGRTKVKQ